jgi:hypothetical protein
MVYLPLGISNTGTMAIITCHSDSGAKFLSLCVLSISFSLLYPRFSSYLTTFTQNFWAIKFGRINQLVKNKMVISNEIFEFIALFQIGQMLEENNSSSVTKLTCLEQLGGISKYLVLILFIVFFVLPLLALCCSHLSASLVVVSQ